MSSARRSRTDRPRRDHNLSSFGRIRSKSGSSFSSLKISLTQLGLNAFKRKMSPKSAKSSFDEASAAESADVSADAADIPSMEQQKKYPENLAEQKRQLSERTPATVEENPPSPPATPTPSPPTPHVLLAAPVPLTSSDRRHTVDEELLNFKNRENECNCNIDSHSKPGAHCIKGPRLDVDVDVDDNGQEDASAIQAEYRGVQHASAEVADDVGSNQYFLNEPYNVPSAYVVIDEESQAVQSGVMGLPPTSGITNVGTTNERSSLRTNLSSEENDEPFDEQEGKGKEKKVGCTLKLPCCEFRLSNIVLGTVLVLGVIVVIIILGARFAHDGDEDRSDTNQQSIAPQNTDDASVEDTSEKPVVDLGNVEFLQDNDLDNKGDGKDSIDKTESEPPISDSLCEINNGGCDPLVTCTDYYGTSRVCGPCPSPGYSGNGIDGCVPVPIFVTDDSGHILNVPEVLTDCTWQKLLAIDGTPDKQFGQNVAIDQDILTISAPKDKEGQGAIYLYERTDVSVCCWSVWYQPPQEKKWKHSKKLTAPDGLPGDHLSQTSISHTTVASGAKNANRSRGAVYVWTHQNDGEWIQEAKLVPDDVEEGDYFGNSLSLYKDTLVAGSRLHNGPFPDSGAAYVFRRKNGQWKQQQKIIPDDVKAHDEFGSRIKLQGNRVVISSNKSDDLGIDSGSAYIFHYNGTKWNQEQKLLPNAGSAYDLFGVQVAIDGDTVVVGAYNDTEQGVTKEGEGSGAAYIFSQSPEGQWAQSAKILAKDGDMGHFFGRQVKIHGNVMIITSLANFLSPDSGAIYVFRRTKDGTWEQQSKLMTKHSIADSFGSGADLDGLTILAGARYDNDNGYRSGSAFVIDLC